MNEHEHENLRRIFDEAIMASPRERDALLERACKGDTGLKRRIEAMIAAAEDDRFMAEATQGDQDGAPTVAFSNAPTVAGSTP